MSNNSEVPCSAELPYLREISARIGNAGISAPELAIFITAPLLVLATIIIFLEQVVQIKSRKLPSSEKLLLILGASAVISMACLVSVIVPRSMVIVNMVNHTYTIFSVYLFILLIESGWSASAYDWTKPLDLAINAPPCCCLVCLPKVSMTRSKYLWFRRIALQSVIFRPLLMVLAAILWTDGNYVPSMTYPAHIFITLAVLFSSLMSLWGIDRIASFQRQITTEGRSIVSERHIGLLLMINLPLSGICGLLVSVGAVPCVSPLSTINRGERLVHMLMIVMMIPIGILGRFTYLKPGGSKVGSQVEKVDTKIELQPQVQLSVSCESPEAVSVDNTEGQAGPTPL